MDEHTLKYTFRAARALGCFLFGVDVQGQWKQRGRNVCAVQKNAELLRHAARLHIAGGRGACVRGSVLCALLVTRSEAVSIPLFHAFRQKRTSSPPFLWTGARRKTSPTRRSEGGACRPFSPPPRRVAAPRSVSGPSKSALTEWEKKTHSPHLTATPSPLASKGRRRSSDRGPTSSPSVRRPAGSPTPAHCPSTHPCRPLLSRPGRCSPPPLTTLPLPGQRPSIAVRIAQAQTTAAPSRVTIPTPPVIRQ